MTDASWLGAGRWSGSGWSDRGKAWCWRAGQDSNLRPSAPEADALSTELPARSARCRMIPGPSADKEKAPPKRGLPLLPDSLTARASFTSGFPLYPYPNLPMALRSVVNRCANSPQRIPPRSGLGQWLGAKNRLHSEALLRPIRPVQPPDSIVTDSMITGSVGTPSRALLTGTAPMASTTSVPPVTLPRTE
jgi:hypothetical protein